MADAKPFGGSHPLASGALGRFLARSRTTALGQVALARGSTVVSANPALGRWFGAERLGALSEILSNESLVRWEEVAGKVVADGHPRRTTLDFQAGGRWSRHRCLIAVDPDARDVVWLLAEPRAHGDVSTRRSELRRARRLAATDALTRLANRRQAERWLRRLDGELRPPGASAACLLIDLDRLKSINDTHGHAAGDAALRRAADVLSATLRAGDRLARFGGDEFLVILPALDPARALAVAERLATSLSAASVSASVGLARARPGEPSGALLARADAALLRAKRQGGGRVIEDELPDTCI